MMNHRIKSSIDPNESVWIACVVAMRSFDAIMRALSLLREMLEKVVLPNIVSYSAAISACEKGV